MMRLVFGLVVVGLGYFGWRWYVEPAAAVAGQPTTGVGSVFEDAGPGAGTPPGGAKSEPGGVPRKPVPLETKTQPKTQHRSIVAAVERGDKKALAIGFATLKETTGPARDALAVALDAAGQRAQTLTQMLLVLGVRNGFLHTEVGRKQARRVVQKIVALPVAQAVRQMTTLLERCMAGPIAKTDQQAAGLVDEIYARHRVLVDRVQFNPAHLTKARTYKVKPGDRLDRIAYRFRKQGIRVEGWTLCYVNRVGRPNLLQADKTIKIPTEPIWVRIEKSSYLMAVYVGEVIVRLYWVGHGKEGKTPATTFTVLEKQPNPDWYAPDGNVYPFGHPKNVLGKYFVKFDHPSLTGFGAHGTAESETIRTQKSHGCIRMRDEDILEFFRFIPRGAKIVIADTQ